MESLRFVACARPACGQVFFLCLRCDRGHRYCKSACAREARRASLLAAGRRYQATLDGRLNHAARQSRYRDRLLPNVTHQRREAAAPSAMVRTSPAAGATEAPSPTGPEVIPHATRFPRLRDPCCARCGRVGRYLRHETLARAGRPEHHRRFRSGAP